MNWYWWHITTIRPWPRPKLHDLDRPARIFNASFGVGLSWGFSEFVLEPGTVSAIIETDHHFTEHALKPVYAQSNAAPAQSAQVSAV